MRPAAPSHIDHITVPCTDLGIAERFYVDLLGAQIARRLDTDALQRLGWSPETIRDNHAAHLQLTLGTGPRLELFEDPDGVAHAPMHPHIGLAVSPDSFRDWHQRLTDHGVPTAGPARLGPPGQASLYFNDPFGNHLELVTTGLDTDQLPVGAPDRSHLDHSWPRGQ
jgi:catechol 2,3-dioxygenase-like lactoylglutathione lyase family enzyme